LGCPIWRGPLKLADGAFDPGGEKWRGRRTADGPSPPASPNAHNKALSAQRRRDRTKQSASHRPIRLREHLVGFKASRAIGMPKDGKPLLGGATWFEWAVGDVGSKTQALQSKRAVIAAPWTMLACMAVILTWPPPLKSCPTRLGEVGLRREPPTRLEAPAPGQKER